MKPKQTKHGMSKHPAYAVWTVMKVRCNSITGRDYHLYGGRGIKVCQRWKTSFSEFWGDMGPTYQPGMHLGRKNKAGDYTPENCRWVDGNTNQEGRREKSNLRIIETPWGPLRVSDAARKIGLTPAQLHCRLSKNWTIERALSIPIQKQKGKNQ